MNSRAVQFFTFDEAVIAARSTPGTDLIGIHFTAPYRHLGLYIISVDVDEPDYVNVSYEGGELFDDGGEEDFYDLSDTPDEAKRLFYAAKSDLGDGDAQVMGMTSEFILQEVLPGLDRGAKYRDQEHFMEVAGQEFRAFWRQS
ncbi:hypothetical protein [Pseudoduganella sp. R-34]|uniref:hypothetical protein n=1 Tax=Pseudoduganella sp. R-34 TaxID=3404062 RepID=UPI003CF82C4A